MLQDLICVPRISFSRVFRCTEVHEMQSPHHSSKNGEHFFLPPFIDKVVPNSFGHWKLKTTSCCKVCLRHFYFVKMLSSHFALVQCLGAGLGLATELLVMSPSTVVGPAPFFVRAI